MKRPIQTLAIGLALPIYIIQFVRAADTFDRWWCGCFMVAGFFILAVALDEIPFKERLRP